MALSHCNKMIRNGGMVILLWLSWCASTFGAMVSPMPKKARPPPPPTTARSTVRTQIRNYVQASGTTGLDDRRIGELVKALESTADESTLRFDPKEVAGMWRVFHAPHIESLSKFFVRFSPIEYHVTKEMEMTSCVKYVTSLGGASGWLCTSGFYTVEPSAATVRIIWDKAWWNSDERERPTPPGQGIFPDLIQSLGKIGFIEPLSFFPVKYVDKDFVIFQFFGFTISAMKQPNPKRGVLVGDTTQ